jgi:Flp pilus assembly protein TadG
MTRSMMSSPVPVRLTPLRAASPRRGTTALEFALVGPLFFVLVLGVIEFGRAFMVIELLNEAAREGCRAAIVEGTSSAQIKLAVTNFLTSASVDGTVASVTVNGTSIDTMETKTMPAYTEMTVMVTVPVSSITWVPNGFIPNGTLTGQYAMRRE